MGWTGPCAPKDGTPLANYLRQGNLVSCRHCATGGTVVTSDANRSLCPYTGCRGPRAAYCSLSDADVA